MMLALLAALALQIDLGGGKPAKTEVKLLSVRPEKTSVQASEVFKLALEIDIPKDWHIYPTTPTSTGSPTKIVSDALEVAGPYEEPKPKTKPKTDVVDAYDYHEGKITIAVPVKLKGGSGKVDVKGILDYQICKDVCLIGKTPFAFTVEVQAAKPEAKLLSVKPEKDGDLVRVSFELEIPKGWYIYPVKPTTTGRPTKLVVEGAELAGPVEEPKPKTKPAAEGLEAYEAHEGTITLVAPLKALAKEVKGTLEYQICDPTTCVLAKTPFSFAVPEGQASTSPARGNESFLVMLGFAFLGGFILNIMPCVLPVLMTKLIGLVRQKDMTAAARRGSALAYTAGVMLCLVAFALVVVFLRSLGKLAGWGFQFQDPRFVIALATLIFVFSLSLLGVFTIPSLATGAASQAGRHRGWVGHLMTGFFVTLVATPCSAPLLGTAMGYAFTLPSWGIVLFFSVVGLGLAFPFLVIGFIPAFIRFMPKPGAWLESFERLMGFVLLATVVWLIDTLGSLTGQRGMTGFLAFLTAVALGAWILGKWGSDVASLRARIVSLLAGLALAVVAGRTFLVTELYRPPAASGFQTENLDFSGAIPWQPFSEENVAAVRAARKPGFIDFTADW